MDYGPDRIDYKSRFTFIIAEQCCWGASSEAALKPPGSVSRPSAALSEEDRQAHGLHCRHAETQAEQGCQQKGPGESCLGYLWTLWINWWSLLNLCKYCSYSKGYYYFLFRICCSSFDISRPICDNNFTNKIICGFYVEIRLFTLIQVIWNNSFLHILFAIYY